VRAVLDARRQSRSSCGGLAQFETSTRPPSSQCRRQQGSAGADHYRDRRRRSLRRPISQCRPSGHQSLPRGCARAIPYGRMTPARQRRWLRLKLTGARSPGSVDQRIASGVRRRGRRWPAGQPAKIWRMRRPGQDGGGEVRDARSAWPMQHAVWAVRLDLGATRSEITSPARDTAMHAVMCQRTATCCSRRRCCAQQQE
jgi:hypothetical protein